jgi:tRNA(Ile)-lysidine synthase
MLYQAFKDTIEKLSLLEKKDKVILGVSGGPDSLALLYLFHKLRQERKVELVCAHFNHQLRPEADSEEKFVAETCKELDIRFIAERKDVAKFFKGDSMEQTARNLRFDFFLKCGRHCKIKKIALAHHKDDLVETVLMRFIRGSGLKGLQGFLPRSKYRGMSVIRPLIETSKEDILDWLKDNKIDYCTDKTNFEDKFLRNKIRLKLLPFLKELNPDIVNNIYEFAGMVAWDYDFIDAAARRAFASLKMGETRRHVKLDLAGLKRLAPALFAAVLRYAIEELKGDTRRIEARHIEELRDLVFKRPGGSIVDLPALAVKKEEAFLVIESLIL